MKHVGLYSTSTHWNSDWGWKFIDKTLIQLSNKYTSDKIVAQEVGANGPIRVLDQGSIDFDVLKSWIGMCQNLHTKVCALEGPSLVPCLKLIDCETRNIVPAESHPYIALSYVWGQSPSSPSNSECLPENLPSTIEDSITATRKLGFRYLWIDRYCINQELPEEVIQQVQKMDLVYQNAQVTIIACAGEDPTYGLPGVGYRRRDLQPRATVGKHLLVSALSDPRHFIQNSKWKTRAWTYQEGILSRRRLIFTDQQVYYECRGMYCCEALNFPLLDLHTKNHQAFRRGFCEGDGIGLFPRGAGRIPKEVIQRIEEYSDLSVNLYKPSDILKGILGILNAFGRSSLQIQHHAGVPFLPSCLKEFPNEEWSSSMAFLSGLCWDTTKTSSRRAGFPSWSWTGWNSPVKWSTEGSATYDWEFIRTDEKVEMGVELTNGKVLDWEIYNQLRDTPGLTCGLTDLIHVSAWTSSLRILRRRRLEKSDEYTAKIKLEEGGYICWTFKMTTNCPLEPNQIVTGIHLVHTSEKVMQDGKLKGTLESKAPALLIVGKVGNIIERIAFGWITDFNCDEYDSTGELIEKTCLRIHPPPLRLVKSWQTIRLG